MKNFYAFLFGVTSIIILIAFFELFIRIVHPNVKPHFTNRDLIQINAYNDSNGLVPSTRGISHGEIVETNEMGFRLTFKKNKTILKNWLYLGDSVTMGIGVSTDNTFAYLADERIKNFKIHNAGVIGHSTHDYVNVTNYSAEKMNISRITLFYCLNDVYSNYKEQEIPGNQVRELGGDVLNFFKLNFRLYDVLKANLFDRPQSYFNFVTRYYQPENPIFQSAVNDIISIKAQCDSLDIKFNIVVLPYEYQLRFNYNFEINTPQRLLKMVLRENGIRIDDCKEFLLQSGHPSSFYYLYGDGIHFSEYGHQAISEYIMNLYIEEFDIIEIM